MEYGKAVYFAGPFQPRGKFDEVVKDHLYLSFDQNEDLMKNLRLEKIFKRYEKHPKFRMLMDMKNMMVKLCKANRIAQRPLLVAVSKLDAFIRAMRALGRRSGFTFPAEAPVKTLMGPQSVQDHLAYTEAKPFPLPEMMDVLDGTNVSESDRKIIQGNIAINTKALEGYQAKVKWDFIELFNLSSEEALEMKNLINFYL